MELLTAETLTDPQYAGAVLLLAPELSAYPLSRADTAPLYTLPPAGHAPPGLVLVRRVP